MTNYDLERDYQDYAPEQEKDTLASEISKKPLFYYAILVSVVSFVLLVVLFTQKHGEPRIIQEAYDLGEVKKVSIVHTGSTIDVNISILNAKSTDEQKVKGK